MNTHTFNAVKHNTVRYSLSQLVNDNYFITIKDLSTVKLDRPRWAVWHTAVPQGECCCLTAAAKCSVLAYTCNRNRSIHVTLPT